MSEDVRQAMMPDRTRAPHLRDRPASGRVRLPGLRRDRMSARRMAAAHKWLIGRVTGRLAAWWPEALDWDWLQAAAHEALVHIAYTDDLSELPRATTDALDVQLRRLIASTDWWSQALVKRARPLCALQRGLILAGRDPTDHVLMSRLHLSPAELRERFMEIVPVYAVDSTALLPARGNAQANACHALTELPTGQQLAAALYFEEKLTLVEIGRVMGISPERAQELTGRALAAIVAQACFAQWAARRLTA